MILQIPMKKTFTILMITFLPVWIFGQGCVAIRGGCGNINSPGNNFNLSKGEFMAGVGARYFKSFRHFRGTHQETNRVADGTEVINHAVFLDLSISYGISDRFYGTVVLPFAYNTRSSMYEHGGNPPSGLGERHSTSSKGLTDMRMGVGYWLRKPTLGQTYNYALGVGVKLPTGNSSVKDQFYNQGPKKDQTVEAVVDQSIQLGDGAVAYTFEMQGFHKLSDRMILNATAFYLLNAREHNNVLTRNGQSYYSCPDQFAARLGAYILTKNRAWSFYAGGRLEGVPSTDIIGGSAGYRRPGYVISAEPGVSFTKNQYSFNLSVPISIIRNRTQSYEDKQRTAATGVFTQGDAAFADYLVNFNFYYRFMPFKKKAMP